jgi:hypothetical protein
MISKLAWLTPALVLTACASKPTAPQPIPALAEQHRCPAYPLPPQALLKAPVKTELPAPDALTATEQAIQLDELIKWIRSQAKVDNNPPPVASPHGD